MTTSIGISKIKDLIAVSKLESAAKLMTQKGQEEKNSFLERLGLHFSSRLNSLSKTEIVGTASYDEMNRNRNAISSAMVDVVLHYEQGTLAALAKDERYSELPTSESSGRNFADFEYYRFLQSVKRFWWAYVAFAVFMSFIIYKIYKFETTKPRSIEEVTQSLAEKSIILTSNNCKIKSQYYPMEINLDTNHGIPTVIGKVPGNTWISIHEIQVRKDAFGGLSYFFKVKVPNSDKYGWIPNTDVHLEDRQGDCFPELPSQ